MPDTASSHNSHTWHDEWQDLMRGIGGAAIIGIPLVYTMEMWQIATLLRPRTVLVLALLAIVVNIGYNYVSGFREDSGFRDSIFDAVESYGLGAVFALVLLFLLRIVDAATPPIDIACKTALEAIPLSLGISIANTQFLGGGNQQGQEDLGRKTRRYPALLDAGITIAGAIVFAANVAPTEEIMLLATRVTWVHLIALILFSLLLSYGIIFVAEFTGLQERRGSQGLLQTPVGETLMSYALSLLVALGLVMAFHDVTFTENPYTLVSAVVVLGLPATIGGAAGRLIVSAS